MSPAVQEPGNLPQKIGARPQGVRKVSSDDDCTNPLEDIEKDEYIEQARELYGAKGVRDMDELLRDNAALFAGGELSQDQKDAFSRLS